jgi:hypothetical protein
MTRGEVAAILGGPGTCISSLFSLEKRRPYSIAYHGDSGYVIVRFDVNDRAMKAWFVETQPAESGFARLRARLGW